MQTIHEFMVRKKNIRKTRVAVLMGGRSPEYEISLITGKEVIKNLPDKYVSVPVKISRDGKKWKIKNKKLERIDLELLKKISDVCFVAMHGPYGEDGIIQGALDFLEIPYTGPGVLASSIGMDKIIFKKVLEAKGINVPKYVLAIKNKNVPKLKQLGDPPYCVKPYNQGSSIGISIVNSKKELKKAIKLAHKYSKLALIEEYIEGTEVTCSILGNENPKALPLVEIVPLKSNFFDYKSKYGKGMTDEIVPAKISTKKTKEIQEIALDVYKILNCKGFSRVDFILKKGGKPVVLEINTIPGLTPMSLFPKAAKAANISYNQLLDKIIQYAIK